MTLAIAWWSVVVLAAGSAAPAKESAAPKPKPATSAPAPAATPAASPSPTPEPTPTPVPTPSITESIDFVKEKLATYGSHDFEVGSADDPNEAGRVSGLTSVKAFDKATCVLTLGRKIDIQTSTAGDPEGDFRDASTIELRIPLKEVESVVGKSALVKLGAFEVRRGGTLTQLEIKAKGDRKPIAVSGVKKIEDRGEKRDIKVSDSVASTYLVFADDEIAGRAKKALENAIGLCQQKREVF